MLIEAELGRARTSAWRGDLSGAERGYRAVLAADPRDPDALAGLGYVYHWQGRDGPAERMATAALAADSTHQAGRELRDVVRSTVGPSTEASANWSNDSDRNTNFWQTLGASAPLAPEFRVFGNVGALEASDPVRDARRVGGEVGLSWAVGDLQFTAAAGARRLSPDTATPRTAATYRGRAAGGRPRGSA